jgi:hypothetical protein
MDFFPIIVSVVTALCQTLTRKNSARHQYHLDVRVAMHSEVEAVRLEVEVEGLEGQGLDRSHRQ